MSHPPMPDLPKRVKVCRMGPARYLTIPREYVVAHDIDVHDVVLWEPVANGFLLKFDPTKVDGEAA